MATPAAETVFVGTSELAALMRRQEWSRTPMGSPAAWPQSVRAIIRTMLTSRYAMWMGWGPDLRFFYNDAYARMTLGAKHPWALGRPAHDVWAEIWPDIGPRIQHVLATGEATWDEGLLLFLERSGFPEETYHTFSYSPLHDDDGRIGGMFCVVTEETTRIIGERRLALLRELASQLSTGQTTNDVWMAVQRALESDARDLPFALVYVAEEGGERLQLVASSHVRRGDPIAPETIEIDAAVWPFRHVMEAEAQTLLVERPSGASWPSGPWQKPASRAIVLPLPQQGQSRPAGVFVGGLNPYRPFDAEYASFVSLFVGQIAAGLANGQAYEAERRRAEALAQIDRAKTTFFSNVSHELRTPLTLMLGPVSDSLASADRTLSGDTLALVHRNGLRLQKLVNTLLDFSRIEAGRMEASYEPIDLAAFTSELASAFESAISRAGLRLVVECRTGGETAYVDRAMWEKVVFNLLSNAFKFTFDGEIGVTVFSAGGRMVLRVRDTGIGIAAAELPRIFERFHRVEGARGRTHEGTGIGLALVHELVKLHGGTIDVESEVNRGTTFTVSIPLGAAHLPADRIRRERRLEPTAVGPDAYVAEASRWLPGAVDASDPLDAADVDIAGDTAGARLVLADDNADMRSYLRGLLGGRWRVELAADGAEALRLARAAAPDLVVSDVMMPRLDGVGLLRELRADPATRHIPVMLLSARAGEEARVEGFEAGADDYVVKPFTARELVARVQAQLLRARMRRVEDEHQRRIAAVFMHAPVPIAILRGPDYVFELANPPYRAIVGRESLLGLPLREALPELDGQSIVELLDQVYRSGEQYVGRSYPVSLRREDGTLEESVFDFVLQPIADPGGAVSGIAVVAFEVTELVRARRAAEEASRAKDEFLAMLGHELRNPLAPILTALQLLRLRGETGGVHERAVIERQVRHLVGLVDDLLDVSRITRGKIRLRLERVELYEVVVRGIELASPLLEQHQHELSIDVADSGLPVLADAARLGQVVSNLLTNAAKYTPAGGRIRVSARLEDDQIVLRVADTGIGIDAQMLPRVFELFAQDGQALDRAHGGLGLGLAIVRSLVSLHGGSASAHSDGRDRGSEFVIRLPAAGSDAAARSESEPTLHAAAHAGLRVLVVDDNVDAGTLLAELLAELGHVTALAHDGPDAIEAARRFRPDVALLDIGLPVMDGFELARQLRQAPELMPLRIVAVTGYGQEHDRARAADAGFDAHLVKPVHVEQLVPLLSQLAQERS